MTNAMPVREARAQRPNTSLALGEAFMPSLLGPAASILSGISGWWAHRAAAAGLSGSWLDVHWAVAAEPPDISPAVAPPEPFTGTAEQIGLKYVNSLPTADRAKNGRHYTPTPLAAELWAMAKRGLGWKRPRPLDGCVLDPACGAGALLLPVLREHLGAAARVDAQLAINALPNYVKGIDNDPSAVWLANVLLASEMLPILARTERARRRPLPALVQYGDGLSAVDAPVRAVIMNPPYGRVRLDDIERARFAETLYGHANLYGLFMATGLSALDDIGVLAALVPTSFLAGRYFENLRAAFARSLTLREVNFVTDRSGSFSGVLQETCLATFTRRKTQRVVVGTCNGQRSEIAQVATPRTPIPWLLPRRADDAPVAAAAISMPLTLRLAGWKVSTGPLVWNRRKKDLGPKQVASSLPVIWAADIDGGTLHRDRARDDVRYLILQGNDDQVMVLDRPAVLIQRTTAPEQNRRLVAIHLNSEDLRQWGGRVVVENHVNVAKPRNESPALSAESLYRLFATETIDRVLRCLSGSVAVSAYELEALPLPDVETLRSWSHLNDDDFAQAVADAYRPVSK